MPHKETRRRASDAEDIINERLRSGAPPTDPVLESDMKAAGGLSRMVDMRIPLWQIVTALSVGGFTLISMWFSLQSLTTSMTEVQATLKAGNTQTMQTLLEIDRLKGRVDRAEETYRDMQAQMVQQQMQARTTPR